MPMRLDVRGFLGNLEYSIRYSYTFRVREATNLAATCPAQLQKWLL